MKREAPRADYDERVSSGLQDFRAGPVLLHLLNISHVLQQMDTDGRSSTGGRLL